MLPLRLWLADYIAERWYLVDPELLRTIGTFAGPALAAFVVMIGWRRAHRDALARDAKSQETAADRDFKNWQRTELAKIVAHGLEVMDSVRTDYGSVHFTASQLEKRLNTLTIDRSKIELIGEVLLANEYNEILTTMKHEIVSKRNFEDKESMREMADSRLPELRDSVVRLTLDVLSDNKRRIISVADTGFANDNAGRTQN